MCTCEVFCNPLDTDMDTHNPSSRYFYKFDMSTGSEGDEIV